MVKANLKARSIVEWGVDIRGESASALNDSELFIGLQKYSPYIHFEVTTAFLTDPTNFSTVRTGDGILPFLFFVFKSIFL